MDVSEYQILEIIKCLDSPRYFIETYCLLETQSGLTRFLLSREQERYLQLINENKLLIIKKKRRSGYSSLLSAYMLWFCLFNEDKVALSGHWNNHNAVLQSEQFLKLHDRLPEFLKFEILSYGKKSSKFDNGSVMVHETINKDTVRGWSISLLNIDEASLLDGRVLESFWHSILPQLAGNTKILLSSSIHDLEKEGYVTGVKENTFFEKLYNSYPRVYLDDSDEDRVISKLKGYGDIASVGVSRHG